MKSLTDNLFKGVILPLCCFLVSITAAGQASQSNPLHVLTIEEGTANVNGEVSKQNTTMDSLAVTKGVIAAEFVKMNEWERKYNNYLKTARGYAEQLKAGTTLYMEGIRTFHRILQLQKAVKYNPVGIAASVSMNNVYLETAAEFINTFNMLSQVVSKGGREQMLNGAERTEILWDLSEQLGNLNRKLHEMALAISFYNLLDVWNTATRGFIDRTHRQIGRDAMDRWQRAYNAANAIR